MAISNYKIALIVLLSITYSIQRPAIIEKDVKVSYTNPEEAGYFEGDMMGVDIDTTKGVPIIITAPRALWPNGVVPYTITPNDYNDTQIRQIEQGLRMLEDATKIGDRYCVKFIPRTTESNWVNIYNGGGCSSYVGKFTNPGPQAMSLKKPTPGSPGTCLVPAIIAHEFIHALGLFHEQSRPDRDDFVNIYWETIQAGLGYNFDKYSTGIELLGFPYDYDSVMHYAPVSFSINGSATITAKIPGQILGQRSRISAIDAAEIRKYYKCV